MRGFYKTFAPKLSVTQRSPTTSMRYYIYTTSKKTSTKEARFVEFGNNEAAIFWFRSFIAAICNTQLTERVHGNHFTLVAENASRKFIFSAKTELERIFGNSKYAPKEAIALEKRIIERDTLQIMRKLYESL